MIDPHKECSILYKEPKGYRTRSPSKYPLSLGPLSDGEKAQLDHLMQHYQLQMYNEIGIRNYYGMDSQLSVETKTLLLLEDF